MNSNQSAAKRISLVRFLRASTLLFAGCLIALAGCKQDEEISVTTVTHPDREPIRICVGAIPRGEHVWFFRMSGPTAEIAKHVSEFKEFVLSAKIPQPGNDDVELTAPKGWRKDQAPPTAMRYAGYRIDAKPKELEVTVSRLEGGDGWLLANLHRWQKQVNMPPAASVDELSPEQLQKDKEKGITWIDLTGLGVHMVSKPPDAKAARGKWELPIAVKAPGRGAKSPFTYTAPEGWKQGEVTNEFMADRFVIGDVQISLTTVGGSLAMNIQRWRKEVGLPPVSDAEAEKSALPMKVAGLPAYFVDVANPNGPPGKNRSLAVTIPMGQTNWFIKMWGPAEAVERNKNSFDAFVKSFKLDAR